MKYIFKVIILILFPFISFACDICGCGVGNNYIGVLPEFQQKIVGLRYRSNQLITHIGAGGTTTHLTTQEKYRIAEIWGGWNISSHWRLMASIPYSINEKTNDGNRFAKNGIGDISVLGFYQILNKRIPQKEKLIVQSLWIGGGLKLATGKYNPTDRSLENISLNLFQLGTGSYDFLLQTMYDIRLNDWGMNIAGGYKINTSNSHKYRYGNRINLNAQLYHKFRTTKGFGIVPNLGYQFESSKMDQDDIIQVFSSGGKIGLGTVGLELNYQKWSIGGNYQTPIVQELAKGMAIAKDRWMLHLAYVL